MKLNCTSCKQETSLEDCIGTLVKDRYIVLETFICHCSPELHQRKLYSFDTKGETFTTMIVRETYEA